MTVSGDHQACNEQDLFIDSDGASIYAVGHYPRRLQAFEFEPSGNVRHVETLEIGELQAAVIANDDGHVYAVTSRSLLAFERDAETGELTRTSSQALSRGTVLAIGDDDGFLFVFDDNGQRTAVFGLADDPSHPARLGSVSQADFTVCGHATARPGTAAADAFCGSRFSFGSRGGAFTVQWRAPTNEIVVTGSVLGTDGFGNNVPDFGGPIDVATSPDGRHVYLTTYEQGILVFERVGN